MLRKKALALMTASTLAFGMAGAPVASAQQEGLVNVNVGDVTILQNVGVGVAANVAAQICGVQVPVAVLARQVVRNNAPFTACTLGDQDAAAPVTITP
jgi:hypothetical protein